MTLIESLFQDEKAGHSDLKEGRTASNPLPETITLPLTIDDSLINSPKMNLVEAVVDYFKPAVGNYFVSHTQIPLLWPSIVE